MVSGTTGALDNYDTSTLTSMNPVSNYKRRYIGRYPDQVTGTEKPGINAQCIACKAVHKYWQP